MQSLQSKPPAYETSDYAESSVMEEVHEVQEDRARSFLQDFIKSKNSEEQQTSSEGTDKQKEQNKHVHGYEPTLDPALQINSHFKELKNRQKEEQRQFHQKLMQELSTTTGRTKPPPSIVSAGTYSKVLALVVLKTDLATSLKKGIIDIVCFY